MNQRETKCVEKARKKLVSYLLKLLVEVKLNWYKSDFKYHQVSRRSKRFVKNKFNFEKLKKKGASHGEKHMAIAEEKLFKKFIFGKFQFSLDHELKNFLKTSELILGRWTL